MAISKHNELQATPDPVKTLVGRIAANYQIDPDKFYKTLTTSVFVKTEKDAYGKNQTVPPTAEEMMSLLVICERYGLDPFTRQIYAFSNRGRIVPIVGIDGWLSIINRQPDYDGMEIEDAPTNITIDGTVVPEYCRVKIFRKSLSRPIVVSEYASEAFSKSSDVWKKYPRRMLRHKAIIQCARVAFSIGGIYEPDEGKDIVEAQDVVVKVDPTDDSCSALPGATSHQLQFQTRDELETAIDGAIKTARNRSNWDIAVQWVNQSLNGTQREYALYRIDAARTETNSISLSEQTERSSVSQPQGVDKEVADSKTSAEPPIPPAANFEDIPY